MRKSLTILHWLLLSGMMTVTAMGCGQEPLPPLPDRPDGGGGTVSDGIPLTIRSTDQYNITFRQDGDDWIISTTGLDPYFWLDAAIPVDFEKQYMLAFDSFNTTEPLPLVIFVGEVCDNDHLLENGDYVLPRTEGWSSVSYDLSKVKTPPAVPFKSVRVRFGLNGQHTFRLRNCRNRNSRHVLMTTSTSLSLLK